MLDQIYSYREMCDIEGVQTLQRGMNFRMGTNYSVILMSQRKNAPYIDKILEDEITVEYQGHDEPKTLLSPSPKNLDQPAKTKKGTLTQNGKFIKAVEEYKKDDSGVEKVKIYEKIVPGVWSFKGLFNLKDYRIDEESGRKVFIFILKLSSRQDIGTSSVIDLTHTRLIPSEIKKDVWKRDQGRCVLCSSDKNLHYDHDLPFSKGGTSLNLKNIRLLCQSCNLSKSNKIE